MVLAQKQTNRSMEKKTDSRNKSMHLWETILPQRLDQKWRTDSLSISNARKARQLHVKE